MVTDILLRISSTANADTIPVVAFSQLRGDYP